MARKATNLRRKEQPQGERRSFDDLLAPHDEPVQGHCRRLKELIVNALPNCTEGIHGGGKVGLALYSITGKVICGIQPAKGKCLFYLHFLSPADSPYLKLEGQGKHARHIRIDAIDAAIGNELTRLVLLARSRAGDGDSLQSTMQG